MENGKFKLVEKDLIASFQFPEGKVLENESDRKFLKNELDRAILLKKNVVIPIRRIIELEI